MGTKGGFLFLWLIGWYIILILFDGGAIAMIVYGSAQWYRFHQQKDTYIKTTCFVNDYSFQQKICGSCSSNGECTTYTCYDEQFNVTYSIFNGSQITSRIKLNGEIKQGEHQVR